MKRLLILLFAIVAYSSGAVAQEAAMTFATLTHDFGTFPEETGNVSYTFEFTNTGKSDLILQNVKASCGCTSPDWTKTPVKSGEKGTVAVTYNATGRPGAFTKTITVIANSGEALLTINGEVTPRQKPAEE